MTGLAAARSLGPAGRGDLASITVWAGTLLYAGTLGLPEAIAYVSAAEPATRARVWASGQAAAAVLGVIVTLAGWWLIPTLFPPDRALLAHWIRWYFVLFATPCLLSLCACAWLQGAGRVQAFNLCRTMVHLVNAGGMTTLFVLGNQSVRHFAGVLLIGNAATWLLATALGPVRRVHAARPSIPMTRRLLQYGIRVQVGNWSNTANVRLDQLLLSLFAAASSLGVYVVGVTYANVLLTLPASAALMMLPQIVRRHGEGASRACVERWYRRLLWATLLTAVALGSTSMVLIPTLFGSAFAAAASLMVLLVPAAVVLGMNQILTTAFRGVGRPEIGSASEVIGVVVTVAALAALLPRYGIYGAAAASLVAYGASHAYLMRQAHAVFGTNVRSLWVPTGEDLAMLRRLASTAERG